MWRQGRCVLVVVTEFRFVSQHLMESECWFKTTSEKYLHKPLQHRDGDTSMSAEHDSAAGDVPGAALVVMHGETFGSRVCP